MAAEQPTTLKRKKNKANKQDKSSSERFQQELVEDDASPSKLTKFVESEAENPPPPSQLLTAHDAREILEQLQSIRAQLLEVSTRQSMSQVVGGSTPVVPSSPLACSTPGLSMPIPQLESIANPEPAAVLSNTAVPPSVPTSHTPLTDSAALVRQSTIASFSAITAFDGHVALPWERVPAGKSSVLSFFKAFEETLTASQIPMEDYLKALRIKLQSIALIRFNTFMLTISTTHPDSSEKQYQAVKSALIDTFTPTSLVEELLSQLASVKQGSRSLEDYVTEFNTLRSYFPPNTCTGVVAEQQIKSYFQTGLNPAHQRLLESAILAFQSAQLCADIASDIPTRLPDLAPVAVTSLSLERTIHLLRLRARMHPPHEVGNRGSGSANTVSTYYTAGSTSASAGPTPAGVMPPSFHKGRTPNRARGPPSGARDSRAHHHHQQRPSVGRSSEVACYYCKGPHTYPFCPSVAQIPDTLQTDGFTTPLTNLHAKINRFRARAGMQPVEFVSNRLAPLHLGQATPSGTNASSTSSSLKHKFINLVDTVPIASANESGLILVSAMLSGLESGRELLLHEVPIDTGAAISCLCQSVASALEVDFSAPAPVDVKTACGNMIAPVGYATSVSVQVGSSLVTTNFLIFADADLACPILLGNSWGATAGVLVNVAESSVSFSPPISLARAPTPSPSPLESLQVYSVCVDPEGATGPQLLFETNAVVDTPNPSSASARTEHVLPSPLNPENTPFGDVRPVSDYSPEEFRQLLVELKVISPTLDSPQSLALMSLLLEFQDVCALSVQDLKEPAAVPPVEISGIPANAYISPPYRPRYSAVELQAIADQVAQWEKAGIVERVIGMLVFLNNILCVKKPDGTFRLCLDPRRLNALTPADHTWTPLVDETLQRLQGCSFFSVLDLCSGYFQFPVHTDSRNYLGFATQQGTFRFTRLPFGLRNACAVFNRTLRELESAADLSSFVVGYFDDLTAHSRSFGDHFQHLRQLFAMLRENNLKVNIKKCRFAAPAVKVLGHIVDSKGLHTDPKKIEAVLAMPEPQTLLQLQSFLGLCNYYRAFVDHFADLSFPLTQLLSVDSGSKSNFSSCWSIECSEAFTSLKNALKTSPVLTLIDSTSKLTLATDASDVGLGAVLSQIGSDGVEHPVAFFSKTLSKAEKKLHRHRTRNVSHCFCCVKVSPIHLWETS